MIPTLYTEEVSIAQLDEMIERGQCFELVSKVSLLAKDNGDNTKRGSGRDSRAESKRDISDTNPEQDDS